MLYKWASGRLGPSLVFHRMDSVPMHGQIQTLKELCRPAAHDVLPGLAMTQPAFELAWGFSMLVTAVFDVAVDVGMLTAPPVGQNVHRLARVSIKGMVDNMYQPGQLAG